MKNFFIGTSRGGTSAVSRMISANSHANVAISPFPEVFRLYRNAILLDIDKNNNIKKSSKCTIF